MDVEQSTPALHILEQFELEPKTGCECAGTRARNTDQVLRSWETQTVPNVMKPLPVQDVLRVFMDIDPSGSSPTFDVLIELLTSDGLLILKVPTPMARELGDSLSRTSVEADSLSEPPATRRSL